MKKIFMLFDKNGSCHHPFFRMLHPGYIVQQEKPMVGLLMIPKTCAYMWMIAMGLQLLF